MLVLLFFAVLIASGVMGAFDRTQVGGDRRSKYWEIGGALLLGIGFGLGGRATGKLLGYQNIFGDFSHNWPGYIELIAIAVVVNLLSKMATKKLSGR